MRAALYARYSSDNQRDASIEDQLRLCREYAQRQGWTVADSYSDRAISGASLLRPGIQELIADASRRRFDVILTESLDRLSRDMEDIAGLYKRMKFAGVRIATLSEGDISDLHIGFKGTMGALYLKDLADKTRRGLRGRVEAGKSGGGNSYGYTVQRRVDADGQPVTGERTINDEEAAIVRRVFEAYADGKSPKRIAVELNRDRIPAPAGGEWGFSTIIGNPKRRTGLLHNELYIGRLVWNRQRFIKDPDTGKRVSRLNPESEWIAQDVPDLRIIDDGLWQRVKERREATSRKRDGDGAGDTSQFPFWEHQRPKYLFSGLSKCGCCGGGFSMVSSALLGCSTSRNKGTCDNRTNIRRDRLEARVLAALREKLMDPALFKVFCDEFTREMNRLRMEAGASIEAARAEIRRIDRDLGKLLQAIKAGGPIESIVADMKRLEGRKAELTEKLASAHEPPPLLHPEMASFYRDQVAQLHEALHDDAEPSRLRAAEAIRSLVDKIVLTPTDGEITIDVYGALAGILHVATSGAAGSHRGGLVAATPSRRAPGIAPLAAQVKLVAGGGFEPPTFRL
jgi:site-specific DNA recombinase